MKIDKSKIGEFGPFEVYETEDRKIRRKFIDVETGLLIIMEQEGNLENKYTGDSHFITINPNTGDIIEIENRGDYINYAEIEEQDVELRIKWKKRRMPWKNGNEYFEFDIFSEEGSKPIEYKYISAFSDEPQKSVSEYYKDYLEGKELRKKEIEDYHKKPYEEKVKFWSGNLHRQMRWNGESGYDEYAIFSKEWITSIRKYEPLIDQILQDVFEKYWKGYWNIDEIRYRLKNN